MIKVNEQADIEIPEDESFEGIEDSAELKTKLDEVQRKHREAGIRNRERTKAQKERMIALEAEIASFKTSTTPEAKPDEKLLKKIGLALFKASGYSDPDELAIFEKWGKDTGKPADEILDHPSLMKVVKAEIEELRTSKANDAATKNIQGKSGAGGDSKMTDPNYWMARGENPPNTPEYRKVREAIIQAEVEKESGQKSL